VPDLVVHPRERELVVATHGRSIYIVDIAPLQELSATKKLANSHLFEIRPTRQFVAGQEVKPALRTYAGANPVPGAVIWVALAEKPAGAVSLKVLAGKGQAVADLKLPATPGLHRIVWDLKAKAGAVAAGPYKVR